jgi:diguanylate cyclase (GGDEF)-like protein
LKKIKKFFRALKLVLRYGEDGLLKDHLTGCYLRLFFEKMAEREISLAERHKNKLCLILVDVDKLKMINDNHGHLEGDKTLKKIVEILEINCRKTDLICRWGGDKFIIIMPDTTISAPKRFLKKVYGELDKFSLSISAGTAFWEKDISLDNLIDMADIKLLTEKRFKKAQT